jgi:WD40 repeat protein
MGNCLSSSSKNHHVRVKGGVAHDDDELNGTQPGKNLGGNHLQNGGEEKHLDSTETSVFDGTEVDTTIPLSPDPAATLDTSTTTATTPTGGTVATTSVSSPIVNGNGHGNRSADHVEDDDDDGDDYDDDGVSVEAALMSTLIAPHKRTDDSPGTEQPAVIFSLLSEQDVSSVRSSNSISSNNKNIHRRNGGSPAQHAVAPSKAFSLATGLHHHQQQQQPQPHHHHTRQGRALQARLQKARYMQMAMNKSSPSSTRSLNSESVSAGSFSSIPEDDDDYQVSNASHLPLRYSMSTGSEMSTPHNHNHHNHNHHKRHRSGSSSASGASAAAAAAGLVMNEEFEANMNKGMIWAEVERDHAVLAVALSRQKPTLHHGGGASSAHTPPPLFLAVGTETGTVTVTELLDDSTSPLLNMARAGGAGTSSSSSSARLGSTVSIAPFRGGGRIRSLDFSPHGNYLAVAGDDCICAICRLDFVGQDYSSSQLTHLQVVAEISRVDRIYAVQFSPNGAVLAIGGFDGIVAIVSMEQQQQPPPRGAAVRGRRGVGATTAAALEPVVVREIPCDSLVLTLDFNPDGQYLAIGMTNKTCVLVDVSDSWQVVYTIRRPASVQTVQWHPNGGRYLAIGSNDVVILDRETLTIKHELDVRGGGGREDATTRSSPSSPNGRHHHQQQQQQQQQQRSVFRVKNVCWSPNGSFLVTNGSDNTCKLLETKAYTTIHEIRRTGITSVVWGQQNVIAGIPHRYLVSAMFALFLLALAKMSA